MKRKKWMALAVSAAMALSLAACGGGEDAEENTGAAAGEGDGTAAAAAEEEYHFNVSVDASEDELISQFAQKFIDEVTARSNGRIGGTLYANGTLGSDSEALQNCADGSLPVVLSTTAPQVNFMPELAMFDLPNLFTDIEQFRALFEDETFNSTLTGIYEDSGFHLLGIADSGFREMSSNVKVESLADLSGVKIRTMQNSNHLAIWQSWGANPTPLAFDEVYIGLQQGTIDAQENPIEVLVASKFYEQQDYVIMTNHLPHACVCLISASVYSELPDDLKQAVDEAGEAATQWTRDQADATIAEQLEYLETQDVEIIELSEEVQASMREAAQPVYDTIREQIGDDMMNLMLEAAEQK